MPLHHDRVSYQADRGLTRHTIIDIAEKKNEPGWMIDFRLDAFEIFKQKPMPIWGPDLSSLDMTDLCYYVKPTERVERSWDDVPPAIKTTFERLGIPQAERQFLAGVGAQYESEVVYKNLKEKWAAQGVVFLDTSTGLLQYPELFRRFFSTIIPSCDNTFAALNSAVWSGGSFVYVPAGVKIDEPLQAYFRINADRMGQFERTLIIAEPGSSVHYVEGCSAPVYQSSSLHSAVVEIVALEGAHVRYTTIQNWSSNVYNLVTKRAHAYRNAHVSWVDGNFGSKVTMKYPSVVLKEPGARAEIISLARAEQGQHQDSGGKVIHEASDTSSVIISKSISRRGGRSSYRGLVRVAPGASGVTSRVQCDALLLDDQSRADAYPVVMCSEPGASIGHEASVSALDEEKVLYACSRGLTQPQAQALIVAGFIEPLVQQLPMEYAVEINRLMNLEMENSIG